MPFSGNRIKVFIQRLSLPPIRARLTVEGIGNGFLGTTAFGGLQA
jgi:hypothetical protein